MGDMMSDVLEFHDRETFRCWLSEHCLTSAGVWLLFGKAGGPKTLKAGEALEEAQAQIQYRVLGAREYPLPNGKKFVQLDFEK